MCWIYKYINASSNTKRDSMFWAKKFSNTLISANSNICKKRPAIYTIFLMNHRPTSVAFTTF